MPHSTLLVIDDEPAIAALIRRAAEASGYEVTATSEAEVFRQEAEAGGPAVICLDISMPQADGIELLRFLAERQVKSKLLIISGFNAQIVQAALRLGEALGLNMAGVVPKPIAMAKLRDLLEQLRSEPGS